MTDDLQIQTFSDHGPKAIVEEASQADRVVATDYYGKKRIIAALHAGCPTIEHENELDQTLSIYCLRR